MLSTMDKKALEKVKDNTQNNQTVHLAEPNQVMVAFPRTEQYTADDHSPINLALDMRAPRLELAGVDDALVDVGQLKKKRSST